MEQKVRCQLVDNKGGYFFNTKLGGKKIDCLPLDTASKVLEVWISPNGKSTQQVN